MYCVFDGEEPLPNYCGYYAKDLALEFLRGFAERVWVDESSHPATVLAEFRSRFSSRWSIRKVRIQEVQSKLNSQELDGDN